MIFFGVNFVQFFALTAQAKSKQNGIEENENFKEQLDPVLTGFVKEQLDPVLTGFVKEQLDPVLAGFVDSAQEQVFN